MTDIQVHDLLDALAETSPEPRHDAVADVHRRAGRRASSHRRLIPVAVAAATVALVLLAVGAVVLTGSTRQAARPSLTTSNEFEALTAGQRFARLFFSTDYRTIDSYSDQIEAGSTGSFRSDFASKRDQLRALMTQVHSVAQGRVLAAATRELTPTSATVLLVVNQDVRNSETRGRTVTNRYRVAEHLRLVDGRWLVEDLEPVLGAAPEGRDCPDPTATAARNELLTQTCAAIATLYSYDYRHIDADIAAQRRLTVGALRDELDSDTGPALRGLAPRTNAVVRANASAAVERDDGNTATVLVFLDQTVTSNVLRQPRYDRNRVEVTMQRIDGKWLVSDIKAL
jgi:hypothetical protein